MPKSQVFTENFLRGLVTTASEDALPFPGFKTFQDIRVSEGDAKRRKGIVRLARASSDNKSLTLTSASSQYVAIPVDTRVWRLGTQFTIEGVVKPTVVTGTRTIVYAGVTTPSVVIDFTATTLRLRVWESDATLRTLSITAAANETHEFQFKRDGATLSVSLYRDGSSAVNTGSLTMDATNLLRSPVGEVRLGRDSSTNYFDGQLDILRSFGIARADYLDGLLRFADPRAGYVLSDYDFKVTADDIIVDRSRFQNHGETSASPTSTTALGFQTSQGELIHGYTTRSGEKRILYVAGGLVHDVDVV